REAATSTVGMHLLRVISIDGSDWLANSAATTEPALTTGALPSWCPEPLPASTPIRTSTHSCLVRGFHIERTGHLLLTVTSCRVLPGPASQSTSLPLLPPSIRPPRQQPLPWRWGAE